MFAAKYTIKRGVLCDYFAGLKYNINFAAKSGELPEWSNGADSKSVDLLMWVRGFESLALRKS